MKISNNKKISGIFDFLFIAENLKNTERWISVKGLKKRESSADHSWKMSLMTMIVNTEFDFNVDKVKVLKMSVVHDLVEAITGDIDYYLISTGAVSSKQKVENELKAIKEIRKMLPSKIGSEIYDLWHEFEEAKSIDARFSKAIDRLETMSHYLSFSLDGPDKTKNWGPNLQATYGDKALLEFPQLLPFLREIKHRLRKRYEKAGIKWFKEYDAV
ncbi:HD domain-containing protein [bacterium]|nr:HD domain-containing protein [bacterium]